MTDQALKAAVERVTHALHISQKAGAEALSRAHAAEAADEARTALSQYRTLGGE